MTTPDVGNGYRLVEVGEQLREGDEVYMSGLGWMPALVLRVVQTHESWVYRRKLPNPTWTLLTERLPEKGQRVLVDDGAGMAWVSEHPGPWPNHYWLPIPPLPPKPPKPTRREDRQLDRLLELIPYFTVPEISLIREALIVE